MRESPAKTGARKPDSARAILSMLAVIGLIVGHLVLSELRRDARQQTQFLRAVRANDIDATRALLNAGMDVNYRYPNLYQSALHEVAWSGQTAMARLLLERGAEPNLANGWTGETPLHAAVRSNPAGMVRLLLDAGANPER
ncbi:MAG: ankyrin repeat domain-containing protein [Aquimonas sp.]|nr:ankyrin repeat domain-containing protein [Aquimonas sp.]